MAQGRMEMKVRHLNRSDRWRLTDCPVCYGSGKDVDALAAPKRSNMLLTQKPSEWLIPVCEKCSGNGRMPIPLTEFFPEMINGDS